MYLQQNVSFFYGNLVPACSLILALIIFLSGKQTYVRHPPAGSVLANTLNIVKEAIKRSRRPSLSSSFVNHWLDRAKLCFGGSYSSWEVEDVKKVYRLLPIFGSFIIYWTVYGQVSLGNRPQEEVRVNPISDTMQELLKISVCLSTYTCKQRENYFISILSITPGQQQITKFFAW